MSTEKNRDWTDKDKYVEAKEMASEHWSYVKAVIETSNPDIPQWVVKMIGFHYISAGTHFYGHGWEDKLNEP